MSPTRWWQRLWGQEPKPQKPPEPVKPPDRPQTPRPPRTSQELEVASLPGWAHSKEAERLLRDRIIMIGTPINDDVANVVVAQLLFLQSEDSKAGISLYINSPGGSVPASLAIRDTMEYVQLPITTICVSQCHGTAALLLACGTRGQRFSLPQGRIRLVPFEVKAGMEDDSRTRHTINSIIELFAERTGQTRETVRENLTHGREFTPEGAIAYGLIDSVVER
ncbi:hypothetical protein BO221_16380 [Archangium sp. Cb G35]|uniref:ClpP family protease n=1 Tax=Archangium sp. Cb G35 TaxID=1920190 RepID=UPI0009375C99|nr:ATP-dependent Clp protease proteolytic subunit [Archangium sp. Cb G35]OJT23578.1 hypothetical protein BO221_16380 [Archangium sp. Cb G35]